MSDQFDNLRVHLFKYGGDDFVSLLDEAGVEYRMRQFPPGTIMNAPEALVILKTIAGLSILPSIAAVIVQWLKNRASRKIIIQTKDNQIVHVEGMDIDEEKLARLLELSESVTAIQNKPDDEAGI